MVLRLTLTFICLYLAIGTHSAILKDGAVIPTFTNICRRSKPDIDNCLKNSIQALLQKISKDNLESNMSRSKKIPKLFDLEKNRLQRCKTFFHGIKELDFPPIDPWFVTNVTFNNKLSFMYDMDVTALGSNAYGFSKLEILGVRSKFDDPQRIVIELDLFCKKIVVESSYTAKGSVTFVDVIETGKSSLTVTGYKGTMKVVGHLFENDGDDYLQIDHSLITPEISGMEAQMTTDSKRFSGLINIFVSLTNRFWRLIYEQLMLEHAEEKADTIYTPLLNRAIPKIPFNQLIPK